MSCTKPQGEAMKLRLVGDRPTSEEILRDLRIVAGVVHAFAAGETSTPVVVGAHTTAGEDRSLVGFYMRASYLFWASASTNRNGQVLQPWAVAIEMFIWPPTEMSVLWASSGTPAGQGPYMKLHNIGRTLHLPAGITVPEIQAMLAGRLNGIGQELDPAAAQQAKGA